MFRVEQNVPDVYVNQSRDFQLFCRLYDIVLQASRFSIDSIEQVSDTMKCNDALLPLVATKVGFFTDLELTSKADRKILSAFPYIVRYKGSMYGIQLVANLFQQIMNTNVNIAPDIDDQNHITMIFEKYIPNVRLLYSLLEYVRPTGVLIDYKIQSNVEYSVDYETEDDVTITVDKDVEPGIVVTVDSKNSDFKDFASNIGFTQLSRVTKDETTDGKKEV